jgi:hypothetical protein
MEEPIRGKARVRSLLFSFLAPLHAMVEVGGASISIRETAIPGDAIDETHSAWTLELTGVSGEICTVSWRIFRKWNESRVVLEHHYDQQQSGEPLTHDDLGFDGPEVLGVFPKPDAVILKWAVPPTGRISNATWDRSVSSNHLYRAVSDRIIAELALLGAGRA